MVGENQCESNCEWTSELPNRTGRLVVGFGE